VRCCSQSRFRTSPRARWPKVESSSRSRSLAEHDLFGKPAPTYRVKARGHAFPDHALKQRNAERRERAGGAVVDSSHDIVLFAGGGDATIFYKMTNPKRGHPLRLGPKTAPLGSGDGAGCLAGSKQAYNPRVQRSLSLGLRWVADTAPPLNLRTNRGGKNKDPRAKRGPLRGIQVRGDKSRTSAL
jgi:hypothetical protein